jgi:hypothetical protein
MDERLLPGGNGTSQIEIVEQYEEYYRQDRGDDDTCAFHVNPANKSASRLAMAWGNKLNTSTTTVENHKRTALIRLGLHWHFFGSPSLIEAKCNQ